MSGSPIASPARPAAVEPVRPTYSVVVPFYNEAESVAELHRRLTAVMADLKETYEFVFINDGSRDDTQRALDRLAENDPHLTVVELRRNFGQTAALVAGFDHAAGQIIISMDGDLQHAPEDIPLLLARLDEGYDLVSGWRKDRVDNLLVRRIPSGIANWLIRRLSGVEIHDFGTTFKVYRRDLLEHIHLYGEMHRFVPALAAGVGARICEVPIQNIVRPKGKSNYGISRTIRVMMDIITIRLLTRYMTRPLHLFGLPALALLVLGFGIEFYLLIEKIAGGWNQFSLITERGPLMMIGVFLMTSSIVFLTTGLLGELIARTYYESQGKHIYIVRHTTRKRG